MGNIVTVDFHGNRLFGFQEDGTVLVAVRPVCEGMGLDWSAQYKRIKRDPILSEKRVMMTIPSVGGGYQEQVCLPIDMIHGWLFTVDSARVKPDLRPKVLVYQRECYAALAAAFASPSAQRVERAGAAEGAMTLTRALRLVTETRRAFGPRSARELWVKLGLPTVPAMSERPAQSALFGEG